MTYSFAVPFSLQHAKPTCLKPGPQQADKVPALLWTELALLMQTPFTEFDFVCNSNNKIPIVYFHDPPQNPRRL